MNKSKVSKRKIFVLVFNSILGVCGILLYYKIYNLYGIGIPCVFHKITGFYCPGCGITRAIFSLLKLDFKSAIMNNLLIFLLSPFMLFYFYIRLKNWFLDKKENSIYPNWVWYLFLTITILFGFLRNINEFSWLAPIS